MKTYGTLYLDAGRWRLEAEAHVVIRFKRMFPRVRTRGTSVWLADNTEVCRDLVWFLDRYPLKLHPKDETYLYGSADVFHEQATLVEQLMSGQRIPEEVRLATPLREYQKMAVAICVTSGSLLLADQLGLGKSASAIGVLARPDALPALVVCPTHLPTQWKHELKKFCPELRTHVLTRGTPYDLTKRTRSEKAEGEKEGMPDVVISNYHKLAGWESTLQGMMKAVCFDEVAELRTGNASNKYTAATAIAEKCRYRIGLSATPLHNWGIEMFNVLDALKPGCLGTQEEFVREWCTYGMKHTSIKDPKAFGLYVREVGLMLRRTREEVGRELPPVSNVVHYVDADTKYLDDVQSAAEELAKIILRQGGSGLEKGAAARELDWRLRQATGIAKMPAVSEIIRMIVEGDEKVLVFAWHRECHSILMDRLDGYKPALYTGSENSRQKEEAKRRFIDGETPILIMSLRSGSGVDGLQHVCRTTVNAELDWSPAVHEQGTGRVFRDGQTSPVTAYYPVTDSGSDPILMDFLQIKNQQIGGVVNPHADLVEEIEADPERMKKLAEGFLRQKGIEA